MSHPRQEQWNAARRRRWAERKKKGLCAFCTRRATKGARCKSHQEAHNRLVRESNLALKREVFEAYGGARCSCKGCPERKNPIFEFLTLNHVGGGGTKHRRALGGKRIPGGGFSFGGQHTYRWLRRKGFPPGYNVLCWNCQWGVHRNNGRCPHNTRRK
jgi:hypothetical protein